MTLTTATFDTINFKNKKVFISQPMKGKSEEQIKMERQNLVDIVTKNGGEVIDSIIKNFDEEIYKSVPLVYLSKSIEFLARADIAIFMPGWVDARGCRTEYKCCDEYEIDILDLS